MTEKNIVYKLLPLNMSGFFFLFILFFGENCNLPPWKKFYRIFSSNPPQLQVLSSPSPFENLVGSSTPHPNLPRRNRAGVTLCQLQYTFIIATLYIPCHYSTFNISLHQLQEALITAEL